MRRSVRLCHRSSGRIRVAMSGVGSEKCGSCDSLVVGVFTCIVYEIAHSGVFL